MVDITGVTSVTPIEMGRTVFGNKRIVIADLVIGNGSSVWPAAGLSLTPEQFGLQNIDFMIIAGGQAKYKYTSSTQVLQAYVAGTASATAVFVIATGATINETIRVVAVGWGLQV
jgi:hypothetical protein